MGFKDTLFSRKTSFNCHGRMVELQYPQVMGIINLTPDSFYPGSRFTNVNHTMDSIKYMVEQGVILTDLGACSTRPGSAAPTEEEEKQRLFPVLDKIRQHFPDIIISIDTWRSAIAREAVIQHGADIINDISAGGMDPEMIDTVASCKVPYILMHMQGTPENMQQNPVYQDFIPDLIDFFQKKTEHCKRAGITDLVLDPGFGFGKTLDQNYILLNRLQDFALFGFPLLVGISRKSMIFKALQCNPEQALNGTTVLNTIALLQGAHILRVHDVKEARETIQLLKQYSKIRFYEQQGQ